MSETDTAMTDAPVEKSEAQSNSQVVDSIEVEPAVKTEDGADVGSEDGDNDAQDEGTDGRPVSNKQYKALKAITEILSDYKITKGNEYSAFAESLEDPRLTRVGIITLRYCSNVFPINETYPIITKLSKSPAQSVL